MVGATIKTSPRKRLSWGPELPISPPTREKKVHKVQKTADKKAGKSPRPVKSKTVRVLPTEDDIVEFNRTRQAAKTKKHKLNRCQKFACKMNVFTPEDVRARVDEWFELAEGDAKLEKKAAKKYARLQLCQTRGKLCPSPQKRDEYRSRKK